MMDTSGKTILIVDDEPSNADLLGEHFTLKGYEVVKAYSGEECISKVSEKPVDLILLDVMMPGKDGFWVANMLRGKKETRLIPVIMLTALKDRESRIKGLEAGVDDFISKPFDREEIFAKVRTSLNLSYYRRQLCEKEKFETVIDEIHDGVVLCSPDWNIEKINRSASEFLDMKASGSKSFLEHIYDNFTLTLPREKLEGGTARHRTFNIVRDEKEDMRPLYLEVNMDLFKMPDGESSSILLVLHNVTEIRREEFLKETFMNLMSHKLRTPLTVIKEALAIARDESSDIDTRELLDAGMKRSSELQSIIEKLLGFTTLYGEKKKVFKEYIELLRYCDEFRTRVMRDKKRGESLEITLDPGSTAGTVNISRTHLDIMMRNLVENAVKFNKKDTVRINLSVKNLENNVKLTVEDNGEGIPPEDRTRVFDKFYQSEKWSTGNTGGMGLGLSIVKHIIDMAGGNIYVESTPGKGTRFVCTFPL